MKIKTCSSNIRIFGYNDCDGVLNGRCLKNQSYSFQIYIESDIDICAPLKIDTDLTYNVYFVKKMFSDHYSTAPDLMQDDYFIRADDNWYPELLRLTDKVEIKKGKSQTLYIEIPEFEKKVGKHNIVIEIDDKSIDFCLEVLDKTLEKEDIYITHWFHCDGICNYYHVKPFSEEFYKHFEQFLSAYVRMGNNMILIPAFTPPLDTQVGGERLTTQLVKVEQKGLRYIFDFSEMERYIDIAIRYGIKYFEMAHLFTQWGGRFCPKIEVTKNGICKNRFGWKVKSTSLKYKRFLKAYFKELIMFLERKNIKDNTFFHLTDEPRAKHDKIYKHLSKFVKKHCDGIRTMDAMSRYNLCKDSKVNIPVVCTRDDDYEKFAKMDRMIYYCVHTDLCYLSNRYFEIPLQRTEILGFQLYEENAKGFLQWAFNFYNTQLSLKATDPYKDATAGGNFFAGDTFIVYPGEKDVEYSIRYFSLKKAFEDYRLLKTLEKKIGKEEVQNILYDEGIRNRYIYPRSAKWHNEFRERLYDKIMLK